MALVSADAHLPTHGGLTPAAPGNVRSCIANIVFSPANVRTPTQERGASAPRGTHSSHANSKRRNSSHCNCRRGLQTHGGLTPAAPGNVRSCIAKGVISPANDRAATQERGASAPRGRPSCETQRTGETQAPLAIASAHPTNCGSRQPPVALINANATAIRIHTVGGLPTNGARVCRCAFAHPRRAHARRSW
jgi:hypothetical protein